MTYLRHDDAATTGQRRGFRLPAGPLPADDAPAHGSLRQVVLDIVTPSDSFHVWAWQRYDRNTQTWALTSNTAQVWDGQAWQTITISEG